MKNKTLVTGGTGMVGKALKEISDNSFIFLGSKDVNLLNIEETRSFFRENHTDIKCVIHLAGKVGGSQVNKKRPYDFFYENMMINTNLLHACQENSISDVTSILSTCIYPELGPFPLLEKNINCGEPHPTTVGYSYSKRMLNIQSRCIRKQFNLNYRCLVPNNLYGINDNFDLNDSHVVPSVIRKIFEAKNKNKRCVLLGDGTPVREFTFAQDFAKIIIKLQQDKKDYQIANVGNKNLVTIKELAHIVCDIFEYDKKEIIWSGQKTNEQHTKRCNFEEMDRLIPGFNFTDIRKGLELTIDWFVENYPNIKGIK